MSSEDPFPRLMERYQRGEEEAFVEIYQRLAAPIERYLARWAGPANAKDLVQETFLQLHRARATYRPELPFRPWAYAIARHVAQWSLRRGRRKVGREVPLDAATELPLAGAPEVIGARLELERAIGRLPVEQQEAVWLADVEGFTSVEIARLTGASEGAIRVRLHRAHQKLRVLFAPVGLQVEGPRA